MNADVINTVFYFFPKHCMWQQWANGVLGLAVLVLPFAGFDATVTTWSVAIAGLVIAALGFWGATEHSAMMSHGSTMKHA